LPILPNCHPESRILKILTYMWQYWREFWSIASNVCERQRQRMGDRRNEWLCRNIRATHMLTHSLFFILKKTGELRNREKLNRFVAAQDSSGKEDIIIFSSRFASSPVRSFVRTSVTRWLDYFSIFGQ